MNARLATRTVKSAGTQFLLVAAAALLVTLLATPAAFSQKAARAIASEDRASRAST